ncbi:MAG: glutamine--fructose-6-phosphate transaminase (isomerizing), partial [Candidatus Woesearchaeota archaeon]
MCGIIAYIGKRQAAPILLKGIQNLEYRGYDSVGMVTKSNGNMTLRKGVGKVADADRKMNFSNMKGTMGIGHTRWATHGKVTVANAHPHISNNCLIAVVHNGIIDNYQNIRQFLKHSGYKFKSQTDTEVIPNLVQYYMSEGKDFKDA